MDAQTPVDSLGYGIFVRSAILSIVAQALKQAELHGLPGEHHFYITFATQVEGVMIPDSLRDRHPDQMTIVIQHQYWDLRVEEAGFHVGLSFDGKPQTLYIPFQAIVSFADPSVHFGLSVPAPALYESGSEGGSGAHGLKATSPPEARADEKMAEQPALFVLSDDMPPRQGKVPTPLSRASSQKQKDEVKKKPGSGKSNKPLKHPAVTHPAASDQKPAKDAKEDKTKQIQKTGAKKEVPKEKTGNVLRMDQFRKK